MSRVNYYSWFYKSRNYISALAVVFIRGSICPRFHRGTLCSKQNHRNVISRNRSRYLVSLWMHLMFLVGRTVLRGRLNRSLYGVTGIFRDLIKDLRYDFYALENLYSTAIISWQWRYLCRTSEICLTELNLRTETIFRLEIEKCTRSVLESVLLTQRHLTNFLF